MECVRNENDNDEYDKSVVCTPGGRKHRNSGRKKKKETRYFLGQNQPPIMKCPHTALDYKGKKECLGKSLSTGDAESMYFACLLDSVSVYCLLFSFPSSFLFTK